MAPGFKRLLEGGAVRCKLRPLLDNGTFGEDLSESGCGGTRLRPRRDGRWEPDNRLEHDNGHQADGHEHRRRPLAGLSGAVDALRGISATILPSHPLQLTADDHRALRAEFRR